mmetsp:Transcript_55156/g.109612  ORF Transcript_55156/g.109612 Transcript_55156/m.109612 type:complete len:86 (+) Transcript_55156:952-1209(+)
MHGKPWQPGVPHCVTSSMHATSRATSTFYQHAGHAGGRVSTTAASAVAVLYSGCAWKCHRLEWKVNLPFDFACYYGANTLCIELL